MTDTATRLLVIDDDARFREALGRWLSSLGYHAVMAASAGQGSEFLEREGDFAAILLDLQLPDVHGHAVLHNLNAAGARVPVVVMSGTKRVEDVIPALRGNAADYLKKPFTIDQLRTSLDRARQVAVERELLDKTVKGAIGVMAEILSLVNPAAFSRAVRIREYVRQIAKSLDHPDAWQFEVAALLSHIGCVTLPAELLDKVHAGQPMSDSEEELFASHPHTAARLLGRIPRLETVGAIIQNLANGDPARLSEQQSVSDLSSVALGTRMLQVAMELDEVRSKQLPAKQALAEILARTGQRVPPDLMAALEELLLAPTQQVAKVLPLAELRTGMSLDQDVRANNGVLLVAKGQEVTFPVLKRLRNIASHGIGVEEPIRVVL